MFQRNYSLCEAFVKQVALLATNQRVFWESPKTVAFYATWEISLSEESVLLNRSWACTRTRCRWT